MAGLYTHGIALPHIVASGNQDLIDRYVRPTLRGEMIGSLGITEPDGGSDVARIRTTAVRDGDHYVVNGAKTFITSAVRGDFVTTAVRTGGPGYKGISLLVIDKGTPGFEVTKNLTKMGWHCSDTAELSFTDVRVPVGNLVGEENSGFIQIARAFVSERLGLAVHGYGIADRALEADRRLLQDARDVRQAADRQPGGAAQARRDAPRRRGGARLHARGDATVRRRRDAAGRGAARQGARRRGEPLRHRRGGPAARRHGLHA